MTADTTELKPLMEMVSRWRLEASVADMTGNEPRSALFSRVASELDTIVASQLAVREEGRRSPPADPLEDIFERIRALPRHHLGTAECRADCAAIDLLRRRAAPAPSAPTLTDAEMAALEGENATLTRERDEARDIARVYADMWPLARSGDRRIDDMLRERLCAVPSPEARAKT